MEGADDNLARMPSTLDHARKLLALAQSGLHFTQEEYDRERYREIVEIATELLAQDASVEPSRNRRMMTETIMSP